MPAQRKSGIVSAGAKNLEFGTFRCLLQYSSFAEALCLAPICLMPSPNYVALGNDVEQLVQCGTACGQRIPNFSGLGTVIPSNSCTHHVDGGSHSGVAGQANKIVDQSCSKPNGLVVDHMVIDSRMNTVSNQHSGWASVSQLSRFHYVWLMFPIVKVAFRC